MHKLRRLVWTIAVLTAFAAVGCTTCTQEHLTQALPEKTFRSEALVLVADGAGDFRCTSEALRRAIATEKLPLRLQTFVWSHGYWRVLADQLDQGHAQKQGCRLAELVLEARRADPDKPIYLVAHSAGSAVVLAAAADLPPDSIERIILFAPSVPADYDLRPVLRSVRREVDVFTSRFDRWYLHTSLFFTSIAQGRRCTAAGCAGFQPTFESPEDTLLYTKLRDFPWEPRLSWTGHDGGHFGCYQQGYLRAFVLPLFAVHGPAT